MTPAGKYLGDWLFAKFMGALLGFFLGFVGVIASCGLAIWLLS